MASIFGKLFTIFRPWLLQEVADEVLKAMMARLQTSRVGAVVEQGDDASPSLCPAWQAVAFFGLDRSAAIWIS